MVFGFDPSDGVLTTREDLATLCGLIKSAGSFGIDMEFQREHTYFSVLQLVQVAVDEDVVVIDPLRVTDLTALYALAADPSVQTVVHAGAQDFEIMYHACGVVPSNVFDTQVAGALAGFGDNPGYGTLVKRVLGVQLSKLETSTDWGQRPLTEAQIAYARADVVHLLELRDRITARLSELGRLQWAAEETAFYSRESMYRKDSRELYLRVRRAGRLNRRELAVLRELAAWREQEAARRDRPRGRIISDELLVEVARRSPTKPSEVKMLRTLPRKEAERSAEAIVAAVKRGLDLPKHEWPHTLQRDEDTESGSAIALLDVVLRQRAREVGVGASYLATRQDLGALLSYVRSERGEPPTLLEGWRREVVGDLLSRVARGEEHVALDPRTGKVGVRRS